MNCRLIAMHSKNIAEYPRILISENIRMLISIIVIII